MPLRVHGLKTARARRFVGRRQPREKASANAQGVRLPSPVPSSLSASPSPPPYFFSPAL